MSRCVSSHRLLKHTLMKSMFSHYWVIRIHPLPSFPFIHPSTTKSPLMKRSDRVLLQRLNARRARAVSLSDRSGFLYLFFDTPGELKVGRTGDVRRRRREWDVACWNPNRVWGGAIWCQYTHRAGKLYFQGYQILLTANRSAMPLDLRDQLLG